MPRRAGTAKDQARSVAQSSGAQADLLGLLTCEPNTEVKRVHPKAMPVILITADEYDVWLRAPWGEARALPLPLPDGSRQIIASGENEESTLAA